jgi:Xaa-Pro aminopeptidase
MADIQALLNKRAEALKAYEDGAFFFLSDQELFYMTGASFFGYYFLITKNHGSRKFYAFSSEMMAEQVGGYFGSTVEVVVIKTMADIVNQVVKKLSADNEPSVAIDSTSITAAQGISFQKMFNEASPKVKLNLKHDILGNARIVKDACEIEKIQKSCEIVSRVFEKIKLELIEGKGGLETELDVHYRILELFAAEHVDPSFVPIVGSGPNSAYPHHYSSTRKIKRNEPVLIDMGCKFEGYCSDLTRTFYLDSIFNKEEYDEVWQAVKDAQDRAEAIVRAGVAMKEADIAAREGMGKYKPYFIHRTGHGLGIDIHEPPSLSSDLEGVFKEGMAITIEPGIYLPAKFGVRTEDTFLVLKDGCRKLTSAKY